MSGRERRTDEDDELEVTVDRKAGGDAAILVYQVRRDGVWHDMTSEEFWATSFTEVDAWRQRVVRGVDFGDDLTGTYIAQGVLTGEDDEQEAMPAREEQCAFCERTARVVRPEDTPEYPAKWWVWICDECLGLDERDELAGDDQAPEE